MRYSQAVLYCQQLLWLFTWNIEALSKGSLRTELIELEQSVNSRAEQQVKIRHIKNRKETSKDALAERLK